ncbi:tetratricopeptide repeat protein [Phormidium sp. LEGE 05292]|uniref:serine/threonine-protein kinase n=1 Tax=[Phormidium] sp. LEGE 05292 TaxID=767427 RepID=UPI001882F33C|nr:serine/threonine-protein kinase [Phormidium sp. LEGE 05292]MBE9225193.1 tetratricopeptide repeat protein [Phormidium sp. LEGE 05292]
MCQNQGKKAVPVLLDDSNLMLGKTLRGRYQIIRQLGSGGFSTTFVAKDLDLPGQPLCVVKQLKSNDSDPSVLQTVRRLFDTEAQVLYRLGKHEQIPQLFAHFEESQEFYLVQEYIQGEDFGQELLTGKTLNESQLIAFLQDILKTLAFVHEQDVIHRDIKPSNLIRRQKDGKIVLIDFGAVKEIRSLVLHSGEQMTGTILIGSSGYMPSEQLKGKPRFNSDIYAVGVTAIQLLTGVSPDEFEENVETGEMIWREHASISNELAVILEKMVRSHFRDRYQSVKEVLFDIDKLYNYTGYATKILMSAETKHTYFKKYFYLLIILLTAGLSFGVAKLWNYLQNQNTATPTPEAIATPPLVSPNNQAAKLLEQGKTLIELQRYEEAINILDQALQIDTKYPDAWVKRGQALSKLQKYEEAQKSYEEALKIKSEYSQAWYERGLALEKLNRDELAQESLIKAIEIQPNYAEAWYNLGEIRIKEKKFQEAYICLTKATEIKPDYSEFWYKLGVVLNQLKQPKKALIALNKALEIESNYVEAWIEHGSTLAELKQNEEALVSFNKALEINSESAEAWQKRGYILGELKRYDEAIASLDKAIQIKSDYAEAWYQRGVILAKLNNDDEAIASLDKATQIKPDYAEAWYHRGLILEKKQKLPEAIEAYNKTIQIWPANQEAIAKRKRLQKKSGS